ncbi:MAG: AAA family ATPase [Vicinamibacterales bacterium]
MYLTYYGLRESPFELTSNPRFLFFTAQHREALSNLEYGLASSKALTVLVGEAGTGKTTLLHAALESDRCLGVRTVLLSNPRLTRAEFVETLATQFELGARAGQSKASLLEALEAVLRERRRRGEITALVVDEAQSLSYELLEEIRLLANMETPTEKLLPLVLAGQPELTTRLNDPELRQLKQRVALRCQIGPLSLPETAAYISSRIRTAGGETTRLFTREAVTLIHEHSHGIPRTISVICDNALVHGFAVSKQPVTRELVLDVCRDFDLRGGPIAPATHDVPAEREPESPARQAGRAGSGHADPQSTAPRGPVAAPTTELEKTENRARVLNMLGLR